MISSAMVPESYFNPGEDAQTVQFIAFEPDRQDLNDFTATNQYRVQGCETVPRRHSACWSTAFPWSSPNTRAMCRVGKIGARLCISFTATRGKHQLMLAPLTYSAWPPTKRSFVTARYFSMTRARRRLIATSTCGEPGSASILNVSGGGTTRRHPNPDDPLETARQGPSTAEASTRP